MHLWCLWCIAAPHHAGPWSAPLPGASDAAAAVPATIVLTSMTAAEFEGMRQRMAGYFREVERIRPSVIELPTSHWPMWSEPDRLAALLDAV